MLGALTSRRAVVVVEGGGTAHAYTTPWAVCAGAVSPYIRELRAAGLPVFTAPGYPNRSNSTARATGCPDQPPTDLQWNTQVFPDQTGAGVLNLLG